MEIGFFLFCPFSFRGIVSSLDILLNGKECSSKQRSVEQAEKLLDGWEGI